MQDMALQSLSTIAKFSGTINIKQYTGAAHKVHMYIVSVVSPVQWHTLRFLELLMWYMPTYM